MIDLVMLLSQIEKQNFVGKSEIQDLISPTAQSSLLALDIITVTEAKWRRQAFLDGHKPNSMHKKYLIKNAHDLIDALDGLEVEDVTVCDIFVEPYFVIRLHLVGESKIIGATKGFDIEKTPSEIWAEAWGD